MSIDVMLLAMGARISPPSKKATLVAMAEYASNDGSDVYPTLTTIAARVGVNPRQAQRTVQELVKDGILSLVGNAGGGAPGTGREYRIDLESVASLYDPLTGVLKKLEQLKPGIALETLQRFLGDQETGDADDTPTGGPNVTPRADTGDSDVTPTGDADDAPGKPEGCHGGRRGVTPRPQRGDMGVTQNIKKRQETEEKRARRPQRPNPTPLPEPFVVSERVRAWAESKGFSSTLDSHAENFVSYVKANGKQYVDWDEALMKCVREDWGGIRKNSKFTEPAAPGAVRGSTGRLAL